MKKTVFLLSAAFAMLLVGCDNKSSSTSAEKPHITYGTYEGEKEDGSLSRFVINEQNIILENVSVKCCNTFLYLNNISALNHEAEQEGIKPTEEELSKVKEEAFNFDFEVYNNQSYSYVIDDDFGDGFNIFPLDENGERINGFFFSYYYNDKAVSNGEGYCYLTDEKD